MLLSVIYKLHFLTLILDIYREQSHCEEADPSVMTGVGNRLEVTGVANLSV